MKYSTLKAVYKPETEIEKEVLKQVSDHAQNYSECKLCSCSQCCLSDCQLIQDDYDGLVAQKVQELQLTN